MRNTLHSIMLLVGMVPVLLMGAAATAATHNAADLTPAAIQAAVNGAEPGDVVVLPAGHNNTDWQTDNTGWSACVKVKAGVSIRGQGSDQTILEQVQVGEDWPTYRFFYFNPNREITAHHVELSGIKLIGATTKGAGIAVQFKDSSFYAHDIDISFKNYGISAYNSLGVVADCSFRYMINDESTATHGSGGYGVSVANDLEVGFTFPWKPLGTADAVFVEDSYFYGCKHGVAVHGDSNTVVRYNTFERGWQAHGHIDSHGSYENKHVGSNVYEVYMNDIHINCQTEIRDEGQFNYGILMRGGSGVFWGNTFHSGDESGAYDAMLLADMDIPTSTVDVETDYPLIWQPRNIWAWDNTIDGEPVDATSHGSEWIVEDRLTDGYYDYRNAVKEGYTSYTYPHPMRGISPLTCTDQGGIECATDQLCDGGTFSGERCCVGGTCEDPDGLVDEDRTEPIDPDDPEPTGDDNTVIGASSGCDCRNTTAGMPGSMAWLLMAFGFLGLLRKR